MKRLIALFLLAWVAIAGNAATLLPVPMLSPTGSSAGQTIVSTGSSSAPGWATVPLSGLSSVAANTVIANFTGASAAPVAFSMPSCSTSSSALNYTSGTGIGCNSAINAATLGGATFAAPGPIGSSTPSTGAFTTLSASSTISGTGFSTYLASPPAIGTTAAAAGKFTTLQATSTITPSSTAGIVGTATNDNANAGSVGEFPSFTNLGPVSLTTGTAANVASASLSAGDWDVQCTGQFIGAGSTTATGFGIGVSTTSATFGAFGSYDSYAGTYAAGNTTVTYSSPVSRVQLTTTTTVYCVVNSTFATSTMTAQQGLVRARRPR
ncbi:TPA: hypothetical protein U2L31_000158 [Burkholderia contaminans]|nr:hypothetical protein [Burkholderia contaminans]